MPYWERFTILGVVVLASLVVARLVHLRMRRRPLAPGAETRYSVLSRTITTAIVFVALLSGLLIIPQVRAIAGALLASSALIGLVLGFAAQKTLSNFVAGLLIAFSQPLRIGDSIVIDGTEGVVEEIRLTYTFVRAEDDSRLVIPNDKLASDTIRNSTIVNRAQRAEITVHVPLTCDLGTVVEELSGEFAAEREAEVFISGLNGDATVIVRALAADQADSERLEHDFRLRTHRRLRAAGVW